MNTLRKVAMVLMVCLSSVGAHAADDETVAVGNQNIVNVAAGNKDFSTLVSLLKKAKLDNVLEGKGPFTVFAPTNKAFDAIPKSDLDALAANPVKLKAVLLYHVVSGDLMSNQIKPGTIKTVQGQNLNVTSKDGKIYVNNIEVVTPDIKASNGVIHAVDTVLMPASK